MLLPNAWGSSSGFPAGKWGRRFGPLESAESIMSKKAVYRLGIGWIEDLTEDLLFRQRRAL